VPNRHLAKHGAVLLQVHHAAVNRNREVKLLVDLRLTPNELDHHANLVLLVRQNGIGLLALERRHTLAQARVFLDVARALAHEPDIERDQNSKRETHRREDSRVRATKLSPLRSAAFGKLRTRWGREELGRLLFHRVALSGFGSWRARFPAHTTPA